MIFSFILNKNELQEMFQYYSMEKYVKYYKDAGLDFERITSNEPTRIYIYGDYNGSK